MRILLESRWLLLLLLATCFLLISAKGGRGGGSRGGSRGGSSRSKPSSSSSSSRYPDRSRDSRPPSYPAPAPKPVEIPKAKPAPAPAPKPSAPVRDETVVRQPAYNPNYKEPSPNQGASQKQPAYNPNVNPPGSNVRDQSPTGNQQPPPYPPAGPPPPYSPAGRPPPYSPGGPPPPYSPAGQPPPYSPGGAPPAYSPGAPPPAYNPQAGQPGFRQPAPYPQQPGINYPQQPGMSPGSYPRQPGMPYPQQPGMHHPQQPGVQYPQQPGINRAPYPQQPGTFHGSYPQQPGMSRPYPQQPLGSNMWHPQSGRPAPAYMNYGGLPTGTNMYTTPHKQKGFLGSLMSSGKTPQIGKKNKYYGSYPGAYGGMGGMHRGGTGGFLGKHGSSIAMFAILPYMAARTSMSLFRPSFGYMPIFMPYPHYHHHHYGHYGHGYGYHDQHYDVYSQEYVGKCNRPIIPKNARISCSSTYKEIDCNTTCEEGYTFEENTTVKSNKCWHVAGVWRPIKNFPACKPVCNETCLNGGVCVRPGVCGCPAEYRGPHCEFHFLKCDIRKLAGDNKIGWVCTHTKNETTCTVKCKAPLEFATAPAVEYKCNLEGSWTPDSMPACVAKGDKTEEQTAETTTTAA